MKLFTIGHGNHTIDRFMQLLENNSIQLLVDVRTAPFSRFNPQYNKENLENSLSRHNFEYAYAGKFLGGRPSDPTCYKNQILPGENADYLHIVNYHEVMKQPWFVQGIVRLLEMGKEQTTAIMCSEENPSECHRHHLIARYMIKNYPEVKIFHIRGDGNVFSADSLIESVDEVPAAQLTLFPDE